jgi:hypothetical protein
MKPVNRDITEAPPVAALSGVLKRPECPVNNNFAATGMISLPESGVYYISEASSHAAW